MEVTGAVLVSPPDDIEGEEPAEITTQRRTKDYKKPCSCRGKNYWFSGEGDSTGVPNFESILINSQSLDF